MEVSYDVGLTLLSLLLVARFGRETRGSDLRDLDPDGHVFDKSGL